MSEQQYYVSARKHRPQKFSELVAQEHVTQTLQNALRLNKLAHAYLFSGPRGVGKTTAARILAKAINCDVAEPEPCRDCKSCQSFEQGRSMSIFEIDAASNNKVEDIRDLRETVQIPPQSGRKKVYIVDEVHMLSKAAFNALLKTLEEPPPHVLFIFATTEPHKVLPTILSRCQRFDFRRIPVENAVAHLKRICSDEQVTADEESLLLLARKGDGALRDALSAFDQAVALCGTDLKYAALAKALGVVDVELFFEATDHIVNRNRAGVLRLVDTLMRSGHDVQEFLGGLAEHLRNLLVAQSLRDSALIEASEITRDRYMKVGKRFSESMLLRLMMAVDEAQRTITTTSHARLRLELALLKMASMQDALELRHAVEKLDELIKQERAARLPPPGARTSTSRQRPERRTTAREPRGAQGRHATVSRSSSPRRRTVPPTSDSESHSTGKPVSRSSPQHQTAPAASDSASRSTGKPVSRSSPQHQTAPPKESRKSNAVADIFGKPSIRGSHDTAPATPPPRDTDKYRGREAASLDDIKAGWPKVMQDVSEKLGPRPGSYLESTKPLRLQQDTLHIGVPNKHHKDTLEEKKRFLLDPLQQLTEGKTPIRRLVLEVRPELEPAVERDDRPFDRGRHLEERARNEPVVRALVDKLGVKPV